MNGEWESKISLWKGILNHTTLASALGLFKTHIGRGAEKYIPITVNSTQMGTGIIQAELEPSFCVEHRALLCSLTSTNLRLLCDLWSHQVLQMEKYSFQIPNAFPTVNKILFKCQKQLQWFTFPLLTVAERQSSASKEEEEQTVRPRVQILPGPFTRGFRH